MLFALLAFMFMSFGLTGGFFTTTLFTLSLIPFILDGGINLFRIAYPNFSSEESENQEEDF